MQTWQWFLTHPTAFVADLKTVILKSVNASMLSSFCLAFAFFPAQVNEGKKKCVPEILGFTHLICGVF